MTTRPDDCCAVVELRRYTLHPGRRDDLIKLFDAEFVEGQEECGIHVIGQFRDVNDADKFVWLRGFVDMEQRRAALDAFYTGTVWRAHREAANETMVDSDDVLLLRPLTAAHRGPHGPADHDAAPTHAYTVETHAATAGADAEAVARRVTGDPTREEGSGELSTRAVYVTRDDENTFPALPVRRDFTGAVVVRRHRDEDAARAYATSLSAGATRPESVYVLLPTEGSALR